MSENNSNEKVNNEVENKVEYVPKSKKSRKGDDGIYVQYRKPSVFSTVLLVLIGVLIGIVIMLLVYVINLNKDVEIYQDNPTNVEQPQEEEKVEEEKKVLDLSLDGEFVKSLYNKIPMQLRGIEPYSDAVTKAENIQDNNKLLFVLRELEKEYKYQVITDLTDIKPKLDNKMQLMEDYLTEVQKFEFDVVKAKYKEIFGADKEVPLIDAETTLGYVYEYVPQDNCYYGHSYAGGGGGYFTHATKVYNCEQNEEGTEVYIYDGFVAFNSKYNNGMSDGFALYTSSDCTDIMIDNVEQTYEQVERVVRYNGMTFDEIFEKYWDSVSKFKHTFKLDSAGNYYWYSSEPVQ